MKMEKVFQNVGDEINGEILVIFSYLYVSKIAEKSFPS